MKTIIFIVGHNNSDADSVFSSILLAEIMNDITHAENIEYRPAILNGQDICSKDIPLIKSLCDISKLKVLYPDEIPNHKYILVDHNDLSQSLANDGLPNSLRVNPKQIITCYDHRNVVNKNKNFDIVCDKDAYSTALLIYRFFKKQGYKFNHRQQDMIYRACASDMIYGHKVYHMTDDKRNLYDNALNELYHEYSMEELVDMYFVSTDKNKPLDNDNRIVNINGTPVHSSIYITKNNDYNCFIDAIKNSEIKPYLGIYQSLSENSTIAIYKDMNKTLSSKSYEGITSRKQIVSDITSSIKENNV